MAHLLPDVEALLVAFLKGHPDVTALCHGRVYTDLPAKPTWPAVRLWRLSGDVPHRQYLGRPHVQVEAWGADLAHRGQTRELAATVQAALVDDLPGLHPLAAVGEVRTVLDIFCLTDPDTRQPYFVAEYALTLHARM